MPVRRMDAKRVANQVVLRSVNERISDLNEAFSAQLDLDAEFVCECPDLACIERVSLTPAEYQRVRQNKSWFILVPHHVDTELEDVVERHEGFSVVSVPEDALPAETPER